MGSFAEVNSGISLGRDQILKAPKHVVCSWYRDSHELQFVEDGVPLLHASVPLVLEDDVEDLPHPLNEVGRQVDHHPAEDDLYGVPSAFYFEQLLEGYWLASRWGIVRRQGSEYMVDSVEQGFADASGVGCLS